MWGWAGLGCPVLSAAGGKGEQQAAWGMLLDTTLLPLAAPAVGLIAYLHIQ